MVTASRTVLRDLLAALLAAGLVVLAAAMVSPGGDTVRGLGPAIHPAAEITPNSLPRTDGDPQIVDEASRQTPGDGHGPAGDHADPDAAVATDAVPAGAVHTGTDQVRDTTTRPVAPAPAGTPDGRAPPESGV